MSSIINGFTIISLIFTLFYLLGLITFITDHAPNNCEMTYMFEYPQYVRISNNFDKKFTKYGLYAYSEGHLTKRARDMHFDGIPIIFIPGNAGSHKQMRSLASVALRKALNSRTPFHFDYFTIDVHGEFSGLNGAVLTEQMAYLNHSIYRILDLYRSRENPPKSVILFGHSMGGIIATNLVSKLPQSLGLVSIVLTLATPHWRAPLMLDAYMHNFYNSINWTSLQNTHTAFISLHGGYMDFLVPPFMTKMRNNKNAIEVATTHVPRSWLAVEHVSILWCKQTVLAINRALFDSVDVKTKQISSDVGRIKAAFQHHLVQHSGTNLHARSSYDLKVRIKNHGEWIERLQRQYSVILNEGVDKPHFYMIRLYSLAQHEMLTILALNMKTVDWIFTCGAHTPRGSGSVCEDFIHLTQHSEITPSIKYKRRSITVNMHQIMKEHPTHTHIVVRVMPTDEPVIIHVDVYNSKDRKQTVNLPHLLSFKKHVLIEETAEKIVRYELQLPELESLIQSYLLYVEPSQCKNQMHHSSVSLVAPWGNDNQHKYITDEESAPLNVRLYSPKPKGFNGDARIVFNLDPICRYKISIKPNFLRTLGQFARFYSPMLIPNIAAVILMSLSCQLRSMSENNYCSSIFVAIKEGAKPYYILPSVKLLSRVMSFGFISRSIGAPDWLILAQEGTDFFVLPLILYVISVGVVWILSVSLAVSLMVFETTIHKLTLKFLARTVSFTVSWSDYVMSALHKLPGIVAATLICLAMSTTGSIALCVGLVFYFLRLTQLSQDYIEELVWYYVKKFGKKLKQKQSQNEESSVEKEPKGDDLSAATLAAHNAMFFHGTLFLIWAILTAINLPSALTWAHNFHFSTTLNPDPAFLPGIVLSVCALPLWQLDLPKVSKNDYKVVGTIVSGLAVSSLIFAQISMFRLNYILSMVFVIVILHQIIGRNRHDIMESEDDPGHVKYKTVRAKLE